MRKSLSHPAKPSQLSEWKKLVDQTLAQIERWATAEKWLTSRLEKTITEEPLGTYSVPELFVRTPQGQLVVEPVALGIVGGEGRIDIMSFPSLNRVLLVRTSGTWKIKTDSYVAWPKSWSKTTFIELANILLS